jgi:hypothetical protein
MNKLLAIFKVFTLCIFFFNTACVTGLNSNQQRKLNIMKNHYPDLYLEEKNVTTA